MTPVAEVTRPKLKILDLFELSSETVEISPGKFIPVDPLSLEQMISLFIHYQEPFIKMYGAEFQKNGIINLTPFLLAAPEMMARIIAIGCDNDDPDTIAGIRKKMPAQLQLIAVEKIWAISVPDPKKFAELLSGVMALLRNANARHVPTSETPTNDSPTT